MPSDHLSLPESSSDLMQDSINDSEKNIIICAVCNLHMHHLPVDKNHSAHCPRCNTQIYRNKETNLSYNLLLAITGLFVFIPTLFIPFLSIHLIGIPFEATLLTGSLALFKEGFFVLGAVVFFCSVLSPILVFGSVISAHLALHFKHVRLLRVSLRLSQLFKHWLTIDVFILALIITAIKMRDYAELELNLGLIFILLSQMVVFFLNYHLSVRRYWEVWRPALSYRFKKINRSHCQHCHLSQPLALTCVRCEKTVRPIKKRAAQKTWALLIAATVCLFPANYLIISVFYSNGLRLEDTIISGAVNFYTSGMPIIAAVIFIVSIVVPIGKILVIAYLLCIIRINRLSHTSRKMKLYLFVQWIGKWSILDLFVIAITMALIDRGQILDFSPGPAAIAFAGVVVFTMLATESLDPRLIWRNAPSKQEQQTITDILLGLKNQLLNLNESSVDINSENKDPQQDYNHDNTQTSHVVDQSVRMSSDDGFDNVSKNHSQANNHHNQKNIDNGK